MISISYDNSPFPIFNINILCFAFMLNKTPTSVKETLQTLAIFSFKDTKKTAIHSCYKSHSLPGGTFCLSWGYSSPPTSILAGVY